MTKVWIDAHATPVRQQVCAIAVDSAICKLSTPADPPPQSCPSRLRISRYCLCSLLCRATRNCVLKAAFHITATTDLNLMASIQVDTLEPDPAHRGLALGSRFRTFWLEAERMEWPGKACVSVNATNGGAPRICCQMTVSLMPAMCITQTGCHLRPRVTLQSTPHSSVQGFRMKLEGC
jgi:hypothetical protein